MQKCKGKFEPADVTDTRNTRWQSTVVSETDVEK